MITIVGRRNLIMYGLALMGFAFILFGVISRVEHKPTFIGLSLLIRFLQGFSSCMIQTTMFSLGTNFFPEDKDAMVGYMEAVTGIGLILGPIIGSTLYSLGGYVFIFYSFGSIFVACSTCIRSVFPSYVDNTRNDIATDTISCKSPVKLEKDDTYQSADKLGNLRPDTPEI